jgi:hypothetical protein
VATFDPPDPAAALANPTVPSMFNAYNCVATSDVWKMACAPLPSSLGVAWPGYATTAVFANVNGRDIVIQPWLGWCQNFMGRANFPGGYGAEIGIYVRVPRDRPIPDSPLLPKGVEVLLKGAQLFGGDHLWWPDPDCQFDMSFKVVNPKTNTVMLEASTDKPTYWLNRWLTPDSYGKYKQDLNGQVPFAPSAYLMIYTVAGVQRVWHGAGWEG